MFIVEFIKRIIPGADGGGNGNGNLPKWLAVLLAIAFFYFAFESSSPSRSPSPSGEISSDEEISRSRSPYPSTEAPPESTETPPDKPEFSLTSFGLEMRMQDCLETRLDRLLETYDTPDIPELPDFNPEDLTEYLLSNPDVLTEQSPFFERFEFFRQLKASIDECDPFLIQDILSAKDRELLEQELRNRIQECLQTGLNELLAIYGIPNIPELPDFTPAGLADYFLANPEVLTEQSSLLESDEIFVQLKALIEACDPTLIREMLEEKESQRLEIEDSEIPDVADSDINEPLSNDSQVAGAGDDSQVGLIAGEAVNVRSAPSLNAEVIARLSNVTVRVEATVYARDEEWYLILLQDGRQGFVYGEYVQLIEPAG